RAILHWRIWASSSFLRHYDEAQILLKSQPQICAIGADGGHIDLAATATHIDQYMNPFGITC
ncbi:hypothetical protein, partial [Sphingomonas sp. ACRSK]|uniref:hypothetical protein n=1 Tax=Sphingomonas sp. ACRSK TaxID=2918213 RepID=UPI001EF4124F